MLASMTKFFRKNILPLCTNRNTAVLLFAANFPIFYFVENDTNWTVILLVYAIESFLLRFLLNLLGKPQAMKWFRFGSIAAIVAISLYYYSHADWHAMIIIFVVLDLLVNRPSEKPNSIQSSVEAGQYGEQLFRERLQGMIGAQIDGYITSQNMVVDGRNFEIDFLVLVPQFGLVLVEVKYYSGIVHCGSGREWSQEKGSTEPKSVGNASTQVLRTKSLLQRALKTQKLDKWQVLPVVVFSHDDVEIKQCWHAEAPQTDVIKLTDFDKWIQGLPRSPDVEFAKPDFEALRGVIKRFEAEYAASE